MFPSQAATLVNNDFFIVNYDYPGMHLRFEGPSGPNVKAVTGAYNINDLWRFESSTTAGYMWVKMHSTNRYLCNHWRNTWVTTGAEFTQVSERCWGEGWVGGAGECECGWKG